jgi:hypothetical protein
VKPLTELGEELRSLGHRRRELVDQIVSEIKDKDPASSKDLYQELSDISEQAISLMQQQKEIVDQEIQRIDG